MRQSERDEVEQPLIDQLVAMGWTHLRHGAPGEYTPGSTESGRRDYGQAVLEDRFRAAVRRINLDSDGREWLDDSRLDSLVRRVVHTPERGVPANIAFTEVLTGAELTVEGRRDWQGGVAQPVTLVDWNRPENNDLLVVSQFRVDTPEGIRPYVVLDLVLFVNGLPFVVIECKKPGPTGVDDAVSQVIGYAGAVSVDAPADLVKFAQILVGTDRDRARYGTVTSTREYFATWRQVDEATDHQARREIGTPDDRPLLPLEVLAAEMLRPAALLELVHHYVVSHEVNGRTVKIVARWHQYRAVRRVVRRLHSRQQVVTAHRQADPRGGVVWHTQGSGKSLTMAFLVRVLRGQTELRRSKVVVITDRLDLEEQIRHSLGSTGEVLHRATSILDVREHLARDTPDVLLFTIQKSFRDLEDYDVVGDDSDERRLAAIREQPAINNSSGIVLLIDEAHRSQASWLHAMLRSMVPNAVLIGFTGTPILRSREKTTSDIFGPIVDVYALRDAERDRAIVPLKYEGRQAHAELVEQDELDERFVAAVPGDPARRVRVLDRFARRREVLEAVDVIRAKADDVFRHWVRTALPDRFAAQVVAVSRLAAVRYRDELVAARDRLLTRVEAMSPSERFDLHASGDTDEESQVLLTAWRHRELLRRITVAAVISGDKRKDSPSWNRWTDRERQRQIINRFKAGLGSTPEREPDEEWSDNGDELSPRHPVREGGDPWDAGAASSQPSEADAESNAPIAFIVVKSMLLTGFDAPVEQVLYLDRVLGGVELLQAIARPNRPRRHKTFGLVVDYLGVERDLQRALREYNPEHLHEVVGDIEPSSIMAQFEKSIRSELKEKEHALWLLLNEHDVRSLRTQDEREDLLAKLDDPEFRAEFDEFTRDFLGTVNSALPRPDALAYRDLSVWLGEVQSRARRRYRDGRSEFSPYRYGAKVRELIDTHIRVAGVIQRIPPSDIDALDFVATVDALPDDRARALEMKHALSARISTRMASHPHMYARLSERLAEILRQLEADGDFGQAYMELMELRDVTLAEEGVLDALGLDRWTERPVYSLLEDALGSAPILLNVDIAWASRQIAVLIGKEVAPPHFLYNSPVRDQVRKRLLHRLVVEVGFMPDLASHTADRLLDLATVNRAHFLRLVRQ